MIASMWSRVGNSVSLWLKRLAKVAVIILMYQESEYYIEHDLILVRVNKLEKVNLLCFHYFCLLSFSLNLFAVVFSSLSTVV